MSTSRWDLPPVPQTTAFEEYTAVIGVNAMAGGNEYIEEPSDAFVNRFDDNIYMLIVDRWLSYRSLRKDMEVGLGYAECVEVIVGAVIADPGMIDWQFQDDDTDIRGRVLS